ncbi:unnamed protein product [Paramecium sonneborni]|uniref:Ubiquitin-like domain-containing protein n=1 Tax=Paramecium sonneborni TaxID=65129 RepID=A0A8S1NHF3_9CILI|nr:unnamed protein product [Paramecium sonneborni]
MDQIPIILNCPSKNKVYNIQITSDVTPFDLESEFKEQFFRNEDKLRFFYNNKLLDHNTPLLQQKIVKGSIIIISLIFTVTVKQPIQNKMYTIEINDFMTTLDLYQTMQGVLQVSFEEVHFSLGQETLKPKIPLTQQGVLPNVTILAIMQQKGGLWI